MSHKARRDDVAALLLQLGACGDAVDWARPQPTFSAAWLRCPHGDWLLWLLGRLEIDRRLLVLTACDCVRRLLIHVPAGEDRPRIAIETAEAWGRGAATIDQVIVASAAAFATSADAFATADAASAAHADAYASASAAAAAAAAYAAATASAAYAAASAAVAAADADAYAAAADAYADADAAAAADADADASAAVAAADADAATVVYAYAYAHDVRSESLAASARLVRARVPWSAVRRALGGVQL